MPRQSKIIILFSLAFLLSQSMASPTLVKSSPFLPPQATPGPGRQRTPVAENRSPLDRFEFRGILRVGNQFKFSILDKRSEVSKWVGPGEEENGFRIISYHPGMRELSFLWNGRSGRLKLKTSDSIPLNIVRKLNKDGNASSSDEFENGASNASRGRTLSASQQRALALAGSPPRPDTRRSSRNPPGPISFPAVVSDSSAPAFYRGTSAFAQAGIGPNPSREGSGAGSGSDHLKSEGPRSIFPRNNVHNPNGKIPRG